MLTESVASNTAFPRSSRCQTTDEQHAQRMARAIYAASNKRLTMVSGWDSLTIPVQRVFLELGRRVVEQVDTIKRQADV